MSTLPGMLLLGIGVTVGAIRPDRSPELMIALLKTRIVFREFMEVRHAPVLLRRLTDGWLILTAVTLLGIYSVGTALSSG